LSAVATEAAESGPKAGERSPRWLVPPRLRTVAEGTEERRATWLELFFDLVFVVAIAELSNELVVDHSAGGFLRFAALFVPVWVAWQGYSFYADRFDTDDLLFRLAYFTAMLAIAAMAVLIPDVAHGDTSAGFAVSYVILRSIMLGLYARAWSAVPEARSLIALYGTGYSLSVLIWTASLAVDTPLRYVMWGIGLAVDLSMPPLSTRIHRRVPTSGRHAAERWALFTMIVLGESVVVVALGTAGSEWGLESASAAVLGAVTVTAIWWLYFDRQETVVLRGGTPTVVIYSYAHLPLLMGLAATSSGLTLLIERAGEDELGTGPSVAYLGGVVVFLASLVATRSVTVIGPRRVGVSLKLGAASILVGLIGIQSVMPPVVLAGALAVVLAAVVFAERTLVPVSQPV
jgi:low temperature requirement protein LtrA